MSLFFIMPGVFCTNWKWYRLRVCFRSFSSKKIKCKNKINFLTCKLKRTIILTRTGALRPTDFLIWSYKIPYNMFILYYFVCNFLSLNSKMSYLNWKFFPQNFNYLSKSILYKMGNDMGKGIVIAPTNFWTQNMICNKKNSLSYLRLYAVNGYIQKQTFDRLKLLQNKLADITNYSFYDLPYQTISDHFH